MRMYLVLALTTLVTLLAGCASPYLIPENATEQEIYQIAQDALRDDNYEAAVRALQALEARYPFGPYAEQAQLELIYAQLRNYQEEAAIAAADRFIRLHPQHPNVDYAYYMKGLANYMQGTGLFERFVPTDMTKRDAGPALRSFEDFRQLLYRFPNSNFAPDARARMVYLRSRLARHEINVANYYFRRDAFLAAANRGRYVVENYPGTEAVPDALAVMVQAYRLLKLNDLASDALLVLRTNYPDHPSLDAQGNFIDEFELAGDEERSWVNIATFGLFDRADPPKFDNREPFLR